MNQGHAKSHHKTHNEMERKLAVLAKAALRYRRAAGKLIDAAEHAGRFDAGSRGLARANESKAKALAVYDVADAALLELCSELGGIEVSR